jgi:membrane-associated phospholipid phosphatase
MYPRLTIPLDDVHAKQFIDLIGFCGPIILFFITCLRFIYRPRYLWTFIFVFSTSIGLNRILKEWICEKRPDNGMSIIGEEYSGYHHYGMPSSHAQSVFTTLTYSFLALRSVGWLIFDLFIASLTLYQRWFYRRHTIKQLWVGALVGSGFAYIAYSIFRAWVFHDLSYLPFLHPGSKPLLTSDQ